MSGSSEAPSKLDLYRLVALATDQEIERAGSYLFFGYQQEFEITLPAAREAIEDEAKSIVGNEGIDPADLARNIMVSFIDNGDEEMRSNVEVALEKTNLPQQAAAGAILAYAAAASLVVLAFRLKSISKEGVTFYKADPKNGSHINKLIGMIFGA